MAAQAATADLELLVQGEPSYVVADGERIVQVLANLLSNAIQYTPKGGQIRVLVSDEAKEGIVMVADTGMGIPSDELPLIFERFYRTDRSRNRRTGGTGIGLAIAQAIVLAHGATISVESKVDEGSCFTVRLPKTSTSGSGAHVAPTQAPPAQTRGTPNKPL
jgi:signal transduction histidine kinase